MLETGGILAIIFGIIALFGVCGSGYLLYERGQRGQRRPRPMEKMTSASVYLQGNHEETDLLGDSPVKKALDILARLRSSRGAVTTEEINQVIGVLVANRENFQPEFRDGAEANKNIDEETKAWVVETFLQAHYQKPPSQTGSSSDVAQTASGRRISSSTKKPNSNDALSQGKGAGKQLDTIPSSSAQDLAAENGNARTMKRSSSRPLSTMFKQSMNVVMEKPQHLVSQHSLMPQGSTASGVAAAAQSGTGRQSVVSPLVTRKNDQQQQQMEQAKEDRYNLSIKTLHELDHAAIHRYLEENYNNWNCNMFELEDLTKGHALYFTGLYTLQKYSVLENWKIPLNVVQDWLLMVQREYAQLPYHNSTHGADVLHAMCYLSLENSNLRDKLTMNDVFASIVGAIGHDIDHPGVNNAFLVKTRHRMALMYNDVSVNENHHCAHVFLMTHSSEHTNIFCNTTHEEYEEIRKLIVRLILATDMAKHFQYLTQFRTKTDANALDNPEIPETRNTILEMAIKCADLSNPTKNADFARRMVDNVMEEFFFQGDQERALNIPISNFMDRYNQNVPKCQVGFIDILVSPLFEAWINYNSRTNDKYKHLMPAIQMNRASWVALIEASAPAPLQQQNSEPKNGDETRTPAPPSTDSSAVQVVKASRFFPGKLLNRGSDLQGSNTSLKPLQKSASNINVVIPNSNKTRSVDRLAASDSRTRLNVVVPPMPAPLSPLVAPDKMGQVLVDVLHSPLPPTQQQLPQPQQQPRKASVS